MQTWTTMNDNKKIFRENDNKNNKKKSEREREINNLK